MPTYEYRTTGEGKGCAHCRKGFDAVQRMSEEPLTTCPTCGGAVARAITGCAMCTGQSDQSKLSDGNLKRLGFNKLVNEGGGKFRKTV